MFQNHTLSYSTLDSGDQTVIVVDGTWEMRLSSRP